MDEEIATEQRTLDAMQNGGRMAITALDDKGRQVGLISNPTNVGCRPVFSLWMRLNNNPIATAHGMTGVALRRF